MHDVRMEIHAAATLECGARQHQEAAVLVRIVGVQLGPRVKRIRFHQVYRRDGAGAPDVHSILVPARDDAEALQRRDAFGFEPIAADLRIERHEQTYVVAARTQLAGQGACDVGKAAGLGEGDDFRGDGADGEFHGGGHFSHYCPLVAWRPVSFMRRLLTFLLAFMVLVGSLAIGAAAADLPFWRRALKLPLSPDVLYLPVATLGADTDRAEAAAAPKEGAAAAAEPAHEALEKAVALARSAGSRALLAMHDGGRVLSRYFAADDDHSMLPAGMIARPV